MAVANTYLTAEQVRRVLVQPLEQRSRFLAAVRAAGGLIIDSAGPVVLPKVASGTTPAWYAANAQITGGEPTFDEITLLPTSLKSVKILTRFSNELARQSVVVLDAALRARLVADVAAVVDTQLLSASDGATATLPEGLFSYAGQTMATVGTLTIDDLHDAVGLMLGGNVDPESGGLRWVINAKQFVALRKIKTADTGSNAYVVQPDVTKPGGYTLLGIPVIVTNRTPVTDATPDTDNAALVDFSQIAVARDVAPSVKILDQTYGDFDQQAIRVVTRLDAAPLNDDAIVALTGITLIA